MRHDSGSNKKARDDVRGIVPGLSLESRYPVQWPQAVQLSSAFPPIIWCQFYSESQIPFKIINRTSWEQYTLITMMDYPTINNIQDRAGAIVFQFKHYFAVVHVTPYSGLKHAEELS